MAVKVVNHALNAQSTHHQGHTFDTVILDLDGTLLDTLPDLVVVTNTALQKFGFPSRSSHEIHGFVGNGARGLIYQAVPEHTDQEKAEEVMAYWKEIYPISGNRLTKPYPHVIQTLKALRCRSVHLGVLSNKFEQGVHDALRIHLPPLFKSAHGECDHIPRKPNPAGLFTTISELGSTPEKTLYVGDSGIDIQVARNANVRSISVTWGYHSAEALRRAGAEVLIDDALDLLRFF